MATSLSFAVPLAGEAAYARQRSLNHRMRALVAVGALAFASVAAIAAYAYWSEGLGAGAALLLLGSLVVFEGLRQADRHFIAPLQARCQADFNRQIEALFGPLSPVPIRPDPSGGHPCG